MTNLNAEEVELVEDLKRQVQELDGAPRKIAVNETDDDVIEIDLNHLTIDEIETIEDIVDAPIDSITNPNMRKAKLLKAVGFVIKRRTNPEFRLEDAGKLRVKFDVVPVDPTKSSAS